MTLIHTDLGDGFDEGGFDTEGFGFGPPIYDIAAHATSDLSPVYDVLVGDISTVGANIGALYNIAGRIHGDLTATYGIGIQAIASLSFGVADVEEYDPEELASFAERVLDYVSPVDIGGTDLNHYVGGIGELFQEIEDYARDTPAGPGWSSLLDVDRIPSKGLDWLAQFVGVQIDHDGTDDDLRQQVRSHDRWGRGTPLSIIGPASHWIPGGSKMYMSERNSTAWHVTFILVDVSGPEQFYSDLYDLQSSYHKVRTFYNSYQAILDGQRGEWSKVIDILSAAKPGGIQYTIINTLTTLYMAIYILIMGYQNVYDDYATYQDLYAAPFPDITLDIPVFRQLISTRYYRNVWNQFEAYGDIRDSFVLY